MNKAESSSELHKFMKHFCTRLVQSVVQARMDQLKSHPCRPNPDCADWFNLTVDEIGEVAAFLKSNVKRYPPSCAALSLDFFLYTADADQLPLESWVIRVDKTQADENVNVHTTLRLRYHQMSTLLKSVVMASRFTPIYRYYVKKQSPETFVIFYKVYEGESDLSLLGEGRSSKKIGCLSTPFGTIHLDLHYRMKMELTPTPLCETTNIGQMLVDKSSGQQFIGLDNRQRYLNHEVAKSIDGTINAVPCKGNETTILLGSPVSGDVNIFSASPDGGNQDLPFFESSEDRKSQYKLGRSASSTTEESERIGRHASAESVKSTGAVSPRASSSFPQRAAINRQLRIRNNSFPFASLLVDSQTSFEHAVRSQVLPKVPEHSVIPSGIHTSYSDHTLVKGTANMIRSPTTSLNTSANLTGVQIKEEEEKEVSAPESPHGKVIFACSPSSDNDRQEAMDSQEKAILHRMEQRDAENMDDEKMTTSDDSFVKIIAFASSEDLGSDLSEFVKEIRLAPSELRSFGDENASTLNEEVDRFKGKATEFDTFVDSLREANSEQ